MIKMRLMITHFVVVFALAGCITFPKVHSVQNSRIYQSPYNQAWSYVVSFFDAHDIPIEKMDKNNGIIHAEMSTFSNSLADCGSQGLYKRVSRHANIEVLVKSVLDGTQVTVNTYFAEMRSFAGSNEEVHCNSYGVFESELLNALPSVRITSD